VTYDSMDSFELRERLEELHETIGALAYKYREAVQAEDEVWAVGVGCQLDAALAQARRVKALLKLGAAA
jgi:hypothetical protein